MDVKEAVALAKQSTRELFRDEQIVDLGLEEVEFDDSSGNWLITFSRPWVGMTNPNAIAAAFGAGSQKRREYKIVRISDADKRMISIKNRLPEV
jgi:hypothetical protein